MKRLSIVVALLAICAMWVSIVTADGKANASAQVTIHMKDLLFTPDATNVPVNTTVVFVNDDTVTHTVTASDQSFDSKDIGPGKTWQTTFTKPGTYRYTCIYHPGMSGKITVHSM